MIVLFAGSSGKKNPPKTGSKMNPKNPDSMKKSLRKFKKISNKSLNKSTLAGIRDFIETASDCNSQFKSGNVISTLFQGINLLSSSTENKKLLSFYNEDTKYKKSKVFKTFATIGDNHSKKVNQLINGVSHQVETRELLNTKKDSLGPDARKTLKTTHGLNQRSYSFFRNLHLSVGDVKQLTDFNQHKTKIDKNLMGFLANTFKDEQNKMWLQFNNLNKNNSDDGFKKRKAQMDDSFNNLKSYLKGNLEKKNLNKQKRIVKYNAGLLETNLKLKVMNMLPVYDSSIRIYLMKFNNTAVSSNDATIAKLLNNIMPSYLENSEKRTDNFTKKSKNFFNEKKDEQILCEDIDKHISDLEQETVQFKPIPMLQRMKVSSIKKEHQNEQQYQLVTSLNCNVPRLESFRDKCEIIKYWDRKLSPGDIWNFEITETFREGLYLNKLSEMSANAGLDDDTPISHFIVVEAYGDRSGAIMRKDDGSLWGNEYSPSKLQFEFCFQYKYLALPENPDEIIVYPTSNTSDKEFDNNETAAFYYPNREESLNVDFNDIDLFGEKPKKEARFQLRESIIKIEDSSNDGISSALQDALAYLLKKDPQATITNDEMNFISTEDGQDDDENEEDDDILDLDL